MNTTEKLIGKDYDNGKITSAIVITNANGYIIQLDGNDKQGIIISVKEASDLTKDK